jgi:hypothetical protein
MNNILDIALLVFIMCASFCLVAITMWAIKELNKH